MVVLPIILYFGQFEPSQPFEGDPAQLLPALLDHIQALGELAKQISHAMGGNGHRKAEVARLTELLQRRQ